MPSSALWSSVCFLQPPTSPLVATKTSKKWLLPNGSTLLWKSKMKTTATQICSLTDCRPTTWCSWTTTTSTAMEMLHHLQNSTTLRDGHASPNTRTSDRPPVTPPKLQSKATSWKIASRTPTEQAVATLTFPHTTNLKSWTSLSQTTSSFSRRTTPKLAA